MTDSDRVAVPKDLLAEVLETAEADLWKVHGEFCISTDRDSDGRHACDKDQEKIDALREAAGIDSTGGSEL